jgi:hypothetical protein
MGRVLIAGHHRPCQWNWSVVGSLHAVLSVLPRGGNNERKGKMNEADEYALAAVRTWVWSGFYTTTQIDAMIDDIIDDDNKVDESLVRAAVQPEFEKKMTAESSWGKITDCDRLERAFAELNEAGVIALHNAGYTMSDGFAEVDEVLSRRRREDVRGYCFYHEQDVESAVAGGGLMLFYGDLAADESQKVAIGETVQTALRKAGFEVDWTGDPGQRIFIPGFDWKRRASAESWKG